MKVRRNFIHKNKSIRGCKNPHNTIKKMEKQEKVMNQLYKIGFNLDGSYYSYEERIFTMSKKGVLIEVDEEGLVCGQSINEFLKSI